MSSNFQLKGADGGVTNFEKANRLYEEGKYAAAASAYGQLLTNGEISEAICFNRGNAFFKMNQLGSAIASYREAARISPRDGQVRGNLKLARTRARGNTPDQTNRFLGGLDFLSLNEWTALAAIAFALFFIFLVLGEWRTELKSKFKNGLHASAIAFVIFGLGFAISLHGYTTPAAIVITGETDVRNGPLEESLSIFKVRDGAELEVLDEKSGWVQISDSAQRTGWINQRDITLSGSF